MARYSSGARSTGAGSATLPVGSVYSGASGPTKVREIGIFNTTSNAVSFRLVRLTSTGTRGSTLTAAEIESDAAAALSAAYDTHTVAPTLGDDLGYRATLAAAPGAGIVWTFEDEALRIAVGTGNGIGIVPVGTGQVLDWYVQWEE